MRFQAPFPVLSAIAFAILALASPVPVARTGTPAVVDVLTKLQTAVAGPIATLNGLRSSTVSSHIIVEESNKIYAAVDEATLALGDLKSVQDLNTLFGSSGWRDSAVKISSISMDTLSALASVEPLLATGGTLRSDSQPSIEHAATRVNDLLTNFLGLFNGGIGDLYSSVTGFIGAQVVNLQSVLYNISRQVSQAFHILCNFSNNPVLCPLLG